MNRIIRYLISQADNNGDCTMPLSDIIVETENFQAEMKLKELKNKEGWQISIYETAFGHRSATMVEYKLDYDKILLILPDLINDKLEEEQFFCGIAGCFDDSALWNKIMKHTSVSRILNAVINGIETEEFSRDDVYMLFDSDAEKVFSWSDWEGFKKLGIELWQ